MSKGERLTDNDSHRTRDRDVGAMVALLWRCRGSVVALCWRCGGAVEALWRRCGSAGAVVALLKRCVGVVLALWWYCVSAVLAPRGAMLSLFDMFHYRVKLAYSTEAATL